MVENTPPFTSVGGCSVNQSESLSNQSEEVAYFHYHPNKNIRRLDLPSERLRAHITTMRYSDQCTDLQTYFDTHTKKCIPCNMKWIKPGNNDVKALGTIHFFLPNLTITSSPLFAGYEFVPNCGHVDDGGRRDNYTQKCANNSYNDGRSGKCQTCSHCPVLAQTLRRCNATTDTECCQPG